MDKTNDDQKAYAFVPKYGYGSTAYQRHMISVVVFYHKKNFELCW